ncbi:hypothetical protein D3C85_1416780 [compost metagenome]
MGGLEPERQAGVVDQQIHLLPGSGQASDGGLGGGLVLHVEHQRQEAGAQLLGQGGQPLGTPTGADHPVARAHQQAADGLTEAGRGARYHCYHLNLHYLNHCCYLSC